MLLRRYLPNEGVDILQLFGEQLVTSENCVEMETRGFPPLSHGKFVFFLMLLLTERSGLSFSSGGCELRNIGTKIIGVD